MTARRVLVADRDPRLVQAMRVVLRSAGYQVSVAQDAGRVIALARVESPDLIVIDAGLAGTDGQTITETLEGIAACPLICMSPAERRAHVLRADELAAGLDAWTGGWFGRFRAPPDAPRAPPTPGLEIQP